jgi:hypothetical protein
MAADGATRRPATAVLTATDDSGAKWLVAYFYDVGGRTFERSLPSKVYYPVALALGQPESRIVAVATRCDGADCEAATRTLAEFLDVAANSLRIKG